MNTNLLPRLSWHDSQRKYLMAVINATPDSFSADGLYQESSPDSETLMQHIEAVLQAGADILDIGAESTRPGALPVAADQQIMRLEPVFSVLHKVAEKLPENWCVSLDTSDAEVADWGLERGVAIINDVRGGESVSLLERVVKYRVKIVLMHNSSQKNKVENLDHLGKSYHAHTQKDIVQQVCDDLLDRAEKAQSVGIAPSQIILDPGIGFGKSVSDNLRLIHACDKIKQLGFPVLVGASRKSFLGKILNLEYDERLEAGLMVHGHALMQGADIIRVHDVKEHHRLRMMVEALLHPENNHG